MKADPYENLAEGLAARKNSYVLMLAAKEVDKRAALSRGFLRGVPGNKVNVNGEEAVPRVSEEERRIARDLEKEGKALWWDTPALRTAGDPLPLDHEDVNMVIVRMKAAELTNDEKPPVEFPPWFVKELPFPAPGERVHARQILVSTYRIAAKVWARGLEDGEETGDYDEILIQDWIIRRLQLDAKQLFSDQKLIDRIRGSLDHPPPDGEQLVPSAEVLEKFTKVIIRGNVAPVPGIIGGNLAPIPRTTVSEILRKIARLLHSPKRGAHSGDPGLYREVEGAIGRYVDQLGPVLPGLDWRGFPEDVWKVLELLAWLGGLEAKPFRTALSELADRVPKAPNCATDAARLVDAGKIRSCFRSCSFVRT